MKIGIAVRTMGAQSSREALLACALTAEAAGLDEIHVPDHIAIPPHDAEGSGGRYLDPLTALAWLGAKTERIGLATAVLILPYRPALPTAKAIATVVELTEEGITGRSYVGPYNAGSIKYLLPDIRDFGVLFKGQPVAPTDLYARARKSLHLMGYSGVSMIAVSGLDMAAWDALAKAAACRSAFSLAVAPAA